MFGIGLPEFIFILVIALIVVGPEKLPDIARSLAKQLAELKKTADSFKQSLHETHLKETLDEISEAVPDPHYLSHTKPPYDEERNEAEVPKVNPDQPPPSPVPETDEQEGGEPFPEDEGAFAAPVGHDKTGPWKNRENPENAENAENRQNRAVVKEEPKDGQ